MPRGMHGNNQEKSKDFVGAMKRLFKELKNFRVLIYVALVLAPIVLFCQLLHLRNFLR